ncbi:hypothetical protein D3C72_1988420 [compost metagenome]
MVPRSGTNVVVLKNRLLWVSFPENRAMASSRSSVSTGMILSRCRAVSKRSMHSPTKSLVLAVSPTAMIAAMAIERSMVCPSYTGSKHPLCVLMKDTRHPCMAQRVVGLAFRA